MSALRVAQARWFELLTGRDELGRALRALAGTGEVQLEAHSEVSAARLLPALRAVSDEYRRLAKQYADFLPARADQSTEGASELEELGRAALERLHAWATDAEPIIRRMQKLASTGEELELLREMIQAAQEPSGSSGPSRARLPNLEWLAQAGPVLTARAYRLAGESRALAIPPGVLLDRIEGPARAYLLALGSREAIEALDEAMSTAAARRFDLPSWMTAEPASALAEIASRLERAQTESSALRKQLSELAEAAGVSAALADLALVDWLVEHVPDLTVTEHLAWITGWTSDLTGLALREALSRARVHFLLRFPAAPAGSAPPVVLRNPPWARPFEVFARLLGMPGAAEADPSAILALVAPLLFGFMFGDVGQGAVLFAAGLLLRRRYPATTLLIPGGLAAIGFGFLFGSCFAREDILPALWTRPLARPLLLLEASIVMGSFIILLGLALDALQHRWARRMAPWVRTRAGLVLGYLGLISSALDVRALWAVPAGFLWSSAGAAAEAREHRWKALAGGAAESLEALLQLAVNTLSFVRVGAFALAHAGLAGGVVALAAASASPPVSWLILLLGNVLIVVIETLVVGIQTTRLVLFEFFIRFLHGSGRPFRPLPSPDIQRSVR